MDVLCWECGCHSRYISIGRLTHTHTRTRTHCFSDLILLAAEVIEEVDGGDGSVGDNDDDVNGDDDSDESDDAMDEEGVRTSSGSATKEKKKIEDKVPRCC